MRHFSSYIGLMAMGQAAGWTQVEFDGFISTAKMYGSYKTDIETLKEETVFKAPLKEKAHLFSFENVGSVWVSYS